MITESLEELNQQFLKIRAMGYVKSTRKGYTGIGKTFEDLLGKEEDTSDAPDYKGIEIKTKRGYSNSYTTLFNATPMGKSDYEIERIVKKYGVPDKVLHDKRVLNTSIQGNCCSFVNNSNLFRLEVDYQKRKVYLLVFSKNMNLLEKHSYWSFDLLQSKFEKKLQYLAFVKAWPKTVDGVDYYKYYDIHYYQMKSFHDFLTLIEDGTIRVTFKIGVHRIGERAGMIKDHGTSFQIQEADLLKLFNPIQVGKKKLEN